LAQGTQLFNDFNNLVDKLAYSMVAVPVGNPATMSLSFVKKFIKLQGITGSVKGGDVSNVADSLMETAGKGNKKLDFTIEFTKFFTFGHAQRVNGFPYVYKVKAFITVYSF
jgi:hypothetical protein